MKEKDIQEFELGNHCFGDILRVNSKSYEELSHEDVLEFINEILNREDINTYSFVMRVFKMALGELQYDCAESRSSKCDQCGNWNDYEKYVKPKDE